MKLHYCKTCGVVVNFEASYSVSGWTVAGGERVARCPLSNDHIISEKDNEVDLEVSLKTIVN